MLCLYGLILNSFEQDEAADWTPKVQKLLLRAIHSRIQENVVVLLKGSGFALPDGARWGLNWEDCTHSR